MEESNNNIFINIYSFSHPVHGKIFNKELFNNSFSHLTIGHGLVSLVTKMFLYASRNIWSESSTGFEEMKKRTSRHVVWVMGWMVGPALNEGAQEKELNLSRVEEEMVSWLQKITMTVTCSVPTPSLPVL